MFRVPGGERLALLIALGLGAAGSLPFPVGADGASPPTTGTGAGPINWSAAVVVSRRNAPAWGRMLLGEGGGDDLITYTEYPAGGTPIIKVARGGSASQTWTEIGSIPSPTDHGGHIQEQSQMVRLPDGTILMAMRNHQTDLNWFGLPIVKSTDDGRTWTYVSQLDTNPNSNGRFDRGLWEPFLHLLPGGCVAGFYANEKHAGGSPAYSQVVSERVSCDGGQTWGPEVYAAAQPGGARPGMPGLARMADGRYILVFEVCGTDNCNVHYKVSGDGRTWQPDDLGRPIPNQRQGPYVTVLSSGRVLVASAGTNQLSVSDDGAATWSLLDPPAWTAGGPTWPAIYQTGRDQINLVGNLYGGVQISSGRFGGG